MARLEDRIFEHSVRIPYADVDQMGFVYYANYFVYFEMARSELLREAGVPYGEMEQRGVMLPIVEAYCSYRKPAHFDDLLHIFTRCTRIKGTRLRVEYEIKRDQNLIVTGYTEHVCMSREGKVLRPSPELMTLWNS